jgi:hypothetical protein
MSGGIAEVKLADALNYTNSTPMLFLEVRIEE